jgi:oxalate decarboxylase
MTAAADSSARRGDAPPATDAGSVPNLRFSFGDAHRRVEAGGWAREVTERELPIATTLAGVNMALEPGAFRELHWHKQAEWAYMLSGRARVTALDRDGRGFAGDVGEGDLWFFPAGIPHSIQGLAGGCEFLLVFDDGAFSEDATFSLCDWLAHTPGEVLAKNFGVAREDVEGLPDGERYIFPGALPAGAATDGRAPGRFTFALLEEAPIRAPGGRVRIADATNFPVATTIAAALVDVDPGGLRELHWHPNADEWQYYVSGRGRMTVFAAEGKARTFDYRAGDVGYVPFAMGHHVENTGDTPLRFLELFRSDRFADISLREWMGAVPPELPDEHLRPSPALAGALADAARRPVIDGGRAARAETGP